MTYDEMLKAARVPNTRAKPKNEEYRIQCACVRWFRLQYPKLRSVLFAVPNGGSRNKIEAGNMKQEGVTPGVADLILLKSNRFYGALCIEMKTSAGRQSGLQKAWQREAEANGAKYVICRSLEEFMREVNNYLKDIV